MKFTEYKLKRLNKKFTISVNIRLARELRARMWIAKQLFRLAAFVLNCGIQVDTQDAGDRLAPSQQGEEM